MTAQPEDQSSRNFLGVDRSFTGKRWVGRLTDDRLALALAQRSGLGDLMGRVLAARKVQPDQCEQYLNPSLRELLPDPSSLADMDKAAARIVRAVKDGERIGVFGDYDVDGATSSALLKRFFASVGVDVTVYIPDRIKEGYGPNEPALLKLRDQGIDLLLTVDCGTLAYAPLEAAARAGLEVIVVDHHLAEPALPLATAIVNPNRLDDQSGQGQLAAVGVTFLLVVAIARALRRAGFFGSVNEPDLLQWLDLVALGTICDVVPLTGVNRAFVAQGLRVMQRRENRGLAALADVAGVRQSIGVYDLGFLLGPRVNAGGRVGASDMGMDLLTTDDPLKARALSEQLNHFNRERQAIEATVLEAATAQVDGAIARSGANRPPTFVVAAGDGWHPGVIGIVASRLKDRFDRPCFVISFDESGIGKGSGRSISGVDLGRAVTASLEAGLLLNGGGHAMAAGLTIEAKRLADWQSFMAERLDQQIDRLPDSPQLKLDAVLAPAAATRDLYELLERAGPYGSGNPEPCFGVPRVRVVNSSIVGGSHVRCVLTGEDGARLKGIAFGAANGPLGAALLEARGPLHVAGRLAADDWQGRSGVQLRIADAAPVGAG